MQKLSRYQILAVFIALLFCYSVFPAQAGIATSSLSKSVCRELTPSLKFELSSLNLNFGSPIFIRIFKESNELELWVKREEGYQLFKIYEICCLSGELGPKVKEGDLQSPEGFYFVGNDQLNPHSRFHLSFNLGYPNLYDRTHDRTGSALMVHGNCVSAGCFAMSDQRVEEIYTLAEAALRNGQPFFRVHIFPFRMTTENLTKYKNSKWLGFWKNLKQGYDLFEVSKIPPDTRVKQKKYVFELQRGGNV